MVEGTLTARILLTSALVLGGCRAERSTVVDTSSTRAPFAPPRVEALSFEWPSHADAPFVIADRRSHVGVRVAWMGARAVPASIGEDSVRYVGAFPSTGDIVLVHANDVVEDFVSFPSKPPIEEARYRLDLENVAGLRLVSNVLELLDAHGAPRLRAANPFVRSVDGTRVEASLAISGCRYDDSPRLPFDRPVTPPGSPSCILSVRWSGATYPAVLDPTWSSSTKKMAQGRWAHTQTTMADGKVLVTGGSPNHGLGGTKTAEVFSPKDESWATVGSMLEARIDHAAAALPSGEVVIFGGGGIPALSTVEIYSSGTFSAGPPMKAGRSRPTATYFLGDGGKYWVLVAGGAARSLDDSSNRADAELYGHGTGWTPELITMFGKRATHVATTLENGTILLSGGFVATSEIYRPSLMKFESPSKMKQARSGFSATRLASGKVLAVGGYAGMRTSEIYDPNENTWTYGPEPIAGRDRHVAQRLPNGAILVASGSDCDGTCALTTAELFDPTGAGGFVATSDLFVRRIIPGASLIEDGRAVMLTGGLPKAPGDADDSYEIYRLSGVGEACKAGVECALGVCIDSVCVEQPDTGVVDGDLDAAVSDAQDSTPAANAPAPTATSLYGCSTTPGANGARSWIAFVVACSIVGARKRRAGWPPAKNRVTMIE